MIDILKAFDYSRHERIAKLKNYFHENYAAITKEFKDSTFLPDIKLMMLFSDRDLYRDSYNLNYYLSANQSRTSNICLDITTDRFVNYLDHQIRKYQFNRQNKRHDEYSESKDIIIAQIAKIVRHDRMKLKSKMQSLDSYLDKIGRNNIKDIFSKNDLLFGHDSKFMPVLDVVFLYLDDYRKLNPPSALPISSSRAALFNSSQKEGSNKCSSNEPPGNTGDVNSSEEKQIKPIRNSQN